MTTLTNNSQMHNDIMAAGSKEPKPTTATQEAVPEHTVLETYGNTTPRKRAYSDAKAEAIHMILNQGESLNKQDVKTNLFWEFGKFTLRDGELVKSYYSRNEFNDILAEKIDRNANPLVLVAATQQNKGKEIVKPITPPFESASEEDSDEEHAQRDKQIHKNLALIAKHFKNIYKPTNNLRTSLNTRNKNVDTSLRTGNDSNPWQIMNQRTLTVAGARETIGNQERGVPLSIEQGEWLQDTNEEPSEQELEAHYIYMAKIQEHSEQPESINDTYVVETVDSNVIPNSSDMCDNDVKADQNAKEYEDERFVLANLIANLKLDTDENKKIQKQLKIVNA
ncbi:hypothetical protein Tco_0152599 [Tanacetum coccineum]